MATAPLSLVRGPVRAGKSGRVDQADRYKNRMLQMREDLRHEAIQTLKSNPEYDRIQGYIDALEGRYYPRNYPTWRSQYVDNRMEEARTDSISYMTDLRPTINISTKVKQYEAQTKIFHMLFAHEWRRLKMPLVLAQLQDHANFGTGYLKVGAMLPGYSTIKACGMDSVLPIQRGDTLQESRAVMYRSYRSLEWLTQTYGKEYYPLLRNKSTSAMYGTITSNQYTRPGHVSEYTWNSMSPAMRYHMGRGLKIDAAGPATDAAFPTYEFEEYWIDDPAVNETSQTVRIQHPRLSTEKHNYWYDVSPGQRLWPNKRLTIWAADVLLYDGPGPYWHGLYPFADYTPNPVVWAPGGLSFYRNLMPIAMSINRVGAAFEDVTERVLGQSLIVKDASVRDQNWQSFDPRRPGSKLKMTAMANVAQDLRYGPVPEIPGYASQWEDKLHNRFDRRRGSLDIQALGKKKQVPGADAIEAMRENMTAPFRLKSALLECCLEDLGPMSLANFSQFFTIEQRIRYLGPDGITWQDYDFQPGELQPYTQPRAQHWRNFATEIEPGSMLGSSKDRTELKAMAAYRAGTISLAEFHRRVEIANSDQIMQEMLQEHEKGLGGGPSGRTPRTSRAQRTGKA